VTEMISTHGATWGHRGASGIKPECSLAGYTYAVARGYGALEISLARTSDGVWFGLHDQYLDRVALGVSTMTLDPKLMTWAQVQSYTNIDGYGAPVPFLRWEEYVATYGADVVTIVDPKYALSYKAEFLAMVTRDIGPSRAIIKYSGPGTNSGALSTDARAMGYQTWGFFYIADASTANGGNNYIQTYANNWTLLGMEHGASQAIWDEILAFGKPVYGHIAGTQAYYDTAMAKGASGVQCSGVQVINPVSWWNTTASGAGVFTATYQSSY
jgi:Glycerophosphoryl diester phosphodiesterase